jgi:hypothetical protein
LTPPASPAKLFAVRALYLLSAAVGAFVVGFLLLQAGAGEPPAPAPPPAQRRAALPPIPPPPQRRATGGLLPAPAAGMASYESDAAWPAIAERYREHFARLGWREAPALAARAAAASRVPKALAFVGEGGRAVILAEPLAAGGTAVVTQLLALEGGPDG